MTVAELIAELKKMPQDKPAYYQVDGYYCEVGGANAQTIKDRVHVDPDGSYGEGTYIGEGLHRYRDSVVDAVILY